MSAAQQAELDRRLARLEQDRQAGVTWADLKDELENRAESLRRLRPDSTI